MIIAALFLILIYIGIIVLMIASQWKVFSKAGQPGWASLVPFYNIYIMTQIARKPGWWLAMFFIPIANIVFMIMLIDGIVKSFGKETGFTVGMIFLGIIFWPILAFGDARYIYADAANSTDTLIDN